MRVNKRKMKTLKIEANPRTILYFQEKAHLNYLCPSTLATKTEQQMAKTKS